MQKQNLGKVYSYILDKLNNSAFHDKIRKNLIRRFLSFIRVFAVFSLILIPVFYLYNYFAELSEKNESMTEELIREQLLNEMDRFQEDLNPEKLIEKSFQDLENVFKIPDLNDPHFKYYFNDENVPAFFNNNFIGKAKYYLKNTFGFEPFIFISAGYDLTNIDIEDKDKIFTEDQKEVFLYSCIASILCKAYESDFFAKLKPITEKTKGTLASALNTLVMKCDIWNNGFHNFENMFFIQMIKNISVFYEEIGKPGHCCAFFTNNFGNQKIYQYYNCLVKDDNDNSKFYGLYFVLVKNSDISIEKLLYNASKSSSEYNSSIIRRGISDNKVKIPIWNTDGKIIKYEAPFPSHFYNFISEYKSIDEKTYNIYYNYLNSHSLAVYIDRTNIRNDYYTYKKITETIIYLIIIIFILYSVYVCFNTKTIKLSLSFKVRIIVFIAVSIPIIGLWIITQQGLKNEERIILAKTEKIISERMALLDKIKEDYVNNFTIDLLKHKKKLADYYFSSNRNNIFSDPYFDIKFTDYLKDGDCFSHTILLDKYGKSTGWGIDRTSKGDIDSRHLVFLYKYFLDINLLDQNTPENKKIYGQYVLMSTFMDSYLKSYNRRNVLAKEGLLIPTEGITLKDKASYQLLSPANTPNEPSALIYDYIYMPNIIDNRFNMQLNSNYFELLSQETDSAQIKYAVFTRRESDYREKIQQQRVYPFRLMHLDSVRKAMVKKNSGSEIEDVGNNYYIKTWKYYSDSPVIFVAGAIVSKSLFNILTGKILGLVLIIYTLLAIVLLSDFFYGALLEPIRTLFKFVKEISLGHLNVKINMKTGDEMEELGDSFNKMSDGLCEREKLKRFVSDKLYSSLEKADEQKIIKSNVTILSSDIRSFTTISEKNEPEVVVSLLNDYFTLMEKSIVKYGGSIEKIVGDAISAAFYEDKNPEYALNACKAALEMRENLKVFNEERASKGLFTIENGIGLASGSVMFGFAGLKARRREFLLIGNIIKSAESLEAMTKQAVSSKVYIDKQTYEYVKDRVNLCEENANSEVFYRELLL